MWRQRHPRASKTTAVRWGRLAPAQINARFRFVPTYGNLRYKPYVKKINHIWLLLIFVFSFMTISFYFLL